MAMNSYGADWAQGNLRPGMETSAEKNRSLEDDEEDEEDTQRQDSDDLRYRDGETEALTIGEIRSYVRSLFTEAAVNPASAKSEGLAMFVRAYGGYTDYVLYRSAQALESFAKGDDERLLRSIVACMTVNGGLSSECGGAAVVSSSAAVKGYGPLLYDAVMSLHPEGLAPDRNKVSPAAQRVWQYYLTNRPDVEKVSLKGTKCGQHPVECLNFTYASTAGASLAEEMQELHEENVSSSKNRTLFITALRRQMLEFFDLRYTP